MSLLLVHTAEDYGCDAMLLKAAVSVNQHQRLVVVEKLQQVLKVLKGKTVGLLGLTFKPDTDDLRDAPALTIIEHLLRLGTKVKAYDPIVSELSATYPLSEITLVSDPMQLAQSCDALVLITDWQPFRELDFVKLAQLMHTPILIDGRNFLNQAVVRESGFRYVGIGRN